MSTDKDYDEVHGNGEQVALDTQKESLAKTKKRPRRTSPRRLAKRQGRYAKTQEYKAIKRMLGNEFLVNGKPILPNDRAMYDQGMAQLKKGYGYD
jgi:hypothetical protein